MNDVLPPALLLEILATPEVFIAGMVGALIGLAPFAVAEWLEKRRQRKLDEATDFLMRIGFLEARRRGQIPEDTQ